ncbi:MAG: hypothetical protein KY475_14290 [Planctomycetes bacterium]|nr:hypothetical protein [Planctomycetota bacterium]
MMRTLLILLAFCLFSVTPSAPLARALGGQTPAEEEIAHETLFEFGAVQRDLRAKAIKARINRSARRLARPSSISPLSMVLTGHRLANGLCAPLLR